MAAPSGGRSMRVTAECSPASLLPVLTAERLQDLVHQVEACTSTRELDDLNRRVMRDYKRNRDNAERVAILKAAIAAERLALAGRGDA